MRLSCPIIAKQLERTWMRAASAERGFKLVIRRVIIAAAVIGIFWSPSVISILLLILDDVAHGLLVSVLLVLTGILIGVLFCATLIGWFRRRCLECELVALGAGLVFWTLVATIALAFR